MVEINKEFILSKLRQEDILKYYLGFESIEFNRLYGNPLRQDDSPTSCSFFYDFKGILRFNDFAWRKFDCFDVVMYKYKLTFSQAIIKIGIDFKLFGKNPLSSLKANEYISHTYSIESNFTVKVRDYNTRHLRFWQSFIPTLTKDDLLRANIYCLDTLWINNQIAYDVKYSEIAFVYHLKKGNNYQIYLPQTKLKNKFITSTTNVLVGKQFLNKKANYVVITKSYKDWFLLYKSGVNSVAILSETIINIRFEVFDDFDYVFTLFDNDWKGRHSTYLWHKKYNTIPLLFPKDEPKDYSDNIVKYGIDDMFEQISYYKSYFNLYDENNQMFQD